MKNILFLLLIIGLFSCEKEDDSLNLPTELEDCTFNYTEPAVNKDSFFYVQCPGSPQKHYLGKYHYEAPCFNPNNGNQIAYIRWNTEHFTASPQLWTFDFCTGETKMLCDIATGNPDWSVKDWILFTGNYGELWKVKSNGDSLTQVTFDGATYKRGKWGKTGENIIIYVYNTPFVLLRDKFGNITDTIKEITTDIIDWGEDRLVYHGAGAGNLYAFVGYYNFDTETVNEVKTMPFSASMGGDSVYLQSINYYPAKDAIIWNTRWKVAYVTISDKEEFTVLNGSDSREYDYAQLSPNQKTLIVERHHLWPLDVCEVEVDVSLYLVDIDGKNERKVLIPE